MAVDSVASGQTVTWDGLVSLDRDFVVADGGTLVVNAGTMVVAADSTDNGNRGVNSSLIEIVVRGLLKADGDSANPIEFRGTDTTLVAGWGGIRLDYQGAPAGYGYDNTGLMDCVTVRNAERGITIANIGAPSLSNMSFSFVLRE